GRSPGRDDDRPGSGQPVVEALRRQGFRVIRRRGVRRDKPTDLPGPPTRVRGSAPAEILADPAGRERLGPVVVPIPARILIEGLGPHGARAGEPGWGRQESSKRQGGGQAERNETRSGR